MQKRSVFSSTMVVILTNVATLRREVTKVEGKQQEKDEWAERKHVSELKKNNEKHLK